MSGNGVADGKEYPILQHMACKDPLEDIDKKLRWGYAIWRTGEDMDQMQGTEKVGREHKIIVM